MRLYRIVFMNYETIVYGRSRKHIEDTLDSKGIRWKDILETTISTIDEYVQEMPDVKDQNNETHKKL